MKLYKLFFFAELYKTLTNPPPIRMESTKKNKDSKKNKPIDEPRAQSSEQTNSGLSQSEIPTERVTNNTGSTESSEDPEKAKVNISQEVIYMLLIGMKKLSLYQTWPHYTIFKCDNNFFLLVLFQD